LLTQLASLEGVARLRYTTSHPRDMDDELILAHRDLPALMPFLHLPVQSGSDRILAAMNRKHRADEYRRTVERARAARPDLAVSSDFIVGFPGESDADFEDTMRLVGDVGFASAFSFKYSARPGTPAADMHAQVPEPVKAERLARLQDLLEQQRQAFNSGTVGRTVDVLLEKPGRHPGQLAGKSPYLQPVQIDGGPHRVGDVVQVRIDRAGSNSLFGTAAGVTGRDMKPALTAAA
jgi:tRNA-2-methylthio-N6-dimethylallyladenosine synthase